MNAKSLFIGSVKSNLHDLEDWIAHTERVVALCKKFARAFHGSVDKQLLISAAWLHDIAKFQAGDEHYKPKEVEKALKRCAPDIDIDDFDAIMEIISAHKGNFKPRSCILESAILRICDKLDKFEKGKDNAEEKCEDSMKKIKKKLGSRKYKVLKHLYKKELKELKKWVR